MSGPAAGQGTGEVALPTGSLSIAPGYRFQWEPAQKSHVLLYPEGMIRLSGSAAEIIKRCDGDRDLAAVLADLEAAFPDADLERDVREFLATAVSRGWVVGR